MTDNFEKKVAVDGKCGRAFPRFQALPAGPLGLASVDGGAQAWSFCGCVTSRFVASWAWIFREHRSAGSTPAPADPVQAELDSVKRIGELTMQVELLEAKTETFGPLGRRRSRR